VSFDDLRYSFRILSKSPGFTAVAVMTLALGIGANSAIFSVVNAVLLKSLPYPNADRLVFLNESLPKAPRMNVSWPDYLDWRGQNQVFERMAAIQPNRLGFRGDDAPKLVRMAFVSSDFFALLGAKMALGGTFAADTDRPGAPPTAVVTYAFWRNELKGDSQIVGKSITVSRMAWKHEIWQRCLCPRRRCR
jgi:putative ABC transport system permease protein